MDVLFEIAPLTRRDKIHLVLCEVLPLERLHAYKAFRARHKRAGEYYYKGND